MERTILNMAIEPVKEGMGEREPGTRTFRGQFGVIGGKELFFEFISLLLGETPVVVSGGRGGSGR
jgi:hypothetical protein